MTRQSLLCAAAFSLVASAAGAAPLALTKVTIIDGTGRAPVADGVVVMDGGRITAIGSAASVAIPRGARVVEKPGKFVIPGLMDANLHLHLNLDIDTLLRFRGHYADVVVEAAQLALKSGQTTVFDTWGPYPDLRAARARINSGKDAGARIYFAGNIIGFDGPISEDFRDEFKGILRADTINYLNRRWTQGTGRELLWDTADEVGKRVATYAAKDVDFLKYAANGHKDYSFMAFSQGAQDAIVKAGHGAGKTVQAHVHSLEGIQSAMDAGVDILTHCDITPERTIPAAMIQEMKAKNVSCSALPVTEAYQASQSKKLEPIYANSRVNIKNLIDGGVNVMLSTDAGIQHPLPAKSPEKPEVDVRTKLGEGHFFALQGLEQMGVDPMKALQTATINVARGYKLEKDFGTLEAGKHADMVVLDANPLAAAKNYRAINLVIKGGELVDIAKLPTAPLISNQKSVSAAPPATPGS
ncbi:MAG: amidohydrolase family protein [Pseudomonadota bacterium]